ncbi:hypothetical protein SAMN06272765_7115 [Streptomyces sp. Ag109_G2-15]|nr:hypothetical protein SAMN06272765_7115 [Streptomyces sp. Ag109_G2-15]
MVTPAATPGRHVAFTGNSALSPVLLFRSSAGAGRARACAQDFKITPWLVLDSPWLEPSMGLGRGSASARRLGTGLCDCTDAPAGQVATGLPALHRNGLFWSGRSAPCGRCEVEAEWLKSYVLTMPAQSGRSRKAGWRRCAARESAGRACRGLGVRTDHVGGLSSPGTADGPLHDLARHGGRRRGRHPGPPVALGPDLWSRVRGGGAAQRRGPGVLMVSSPAVLTLCPVLYGAVVYAVRKRKALAPLPVPRPPGVGRGAGEPAARGGGHQLP